MYNECMSPIKKVVIGLIIVVTSILLLWGYQHFKVFSAEMSGKAKLIEAEQSRKVIIEQAKAELEAAQMTADAISIVGEVASKYPEYRQQMFIQGFSEALKEGKINQIIYVPTEASIPILEAGKK